MAAQDRGPTGAEVPLVGQPLRDGPAGLKAVVEMPSPLSVGRGGILGCGLIETRSTHSPP